MNLKALRPRLIAFTGNFPSPEHPGFTKSN